MLALQSLVLQPRLGRSQQAERRLQGVGALRPAACRGQHRRAIRARGVEQEIDIVLVPWTSAEESWSEEAKEAMDRMVARFKAADADG